MSIHSKICSSNAEFQSNDEPGRKRVDELPFRTVQAELGGAEAARQKHIARGKLLARVGINVLLDVRSGFLELSPPAYVPGAQGPGLDLQHDVDGKTFPRLRPCNVWILKHSNRTVSRNAYRPLA
jgi:3-methylcrotonyl-CoA carboxylase beta subunit